MVKRLTKKVRINFEKRAAEPVKPGETFTEDEILTGLFFNVPPAKNVIDAPYILIPLRRVVVHTRQVEHDFWNLLIAERLPDDVAGFIKEADARLETFKKEKVNGRKDKESIFRPGKDTAESQTRLSHRGDGADGWGD